MVISCEPSRKEKISNEQNKDEQLIQLRLELNSKSRKSELPEIIKPFRSCWRKLRIEDNVIYKEEVRSDVTEEEPHPSDAEKQQHYLEEVLREPEKWGKKCVMAWDKKTAAQKAWPAPHLHFKILPSRLRSITRQVDFSRQLAGGSPKKR